MIQMQAQQNVGGIAGLAVLTPTVHGDDRGYFMETYNQRDMESLGFHYDFVQDNQSGSTYGVLRGLQDTRTTLLVSALGFGANIVLNAVLIYGAGLGVVGSGVGTALAQWGMAVAYILLVRRAARRERAGPP